MTVNYTTNLALGQPVTGTESGTWGDDVNNSVTSYLDIAIAGGLSVTVTTTDVTLVLTQGTSSATNIGSTTAQYAILNVSGAMTAARNLILPSSSRQYVINNNTTGGFARTVKGSATSGVTMVNGEKAHVFWNGSDYAKVANTAGVATFTSLTLSDGTANGVAYLNGSKVLTTGSALTFDGTNFATTGTATAAKLIPTGSSATGNGMYLPATNALGFSTAGTNAVYIDASQNVGIGTTSPANKLDVSGTGTVSARVTSSSNTGISSLYTVNSSGSISGSAIYGASATPYGSIGANESTFYSSVSTTIMSDNASGVIKFATGGTTERMRIDSSGNVGIGGTPAYKLDITSSAFIGSRLTAATGTNGVSQIYTNTGGTFSIGIDASTGANFGAAYGGFLWHAGAYPLLFGTSNTERMRINSSGNVGIGTSGPVANTRLTLSDTNSSKLNITGGSNQNGMTFAITGTSNEYYMAGGVNLLVGGDKGFLIYDVTNAKAKFFVEDITGETRTLATTFLSYYTGASERMRIDASGNVGIGTSSPGFKLQVSGAIYQDNGYAQFGNYNAGGANSPVAGGISFSTNATNGQAEADVWNGNDPALYTNTGILFTQRLTSTTRRDLMFLHNNGNVGIGTNSPGAALNIARTSANAQILVSTTTSGNPSIYLDASGVNNGQLFVDRTDAGITKLQAGGVLVFQSNGANERMRIDSSGNVLVTNPAGLGYGTGSGGTVTQATSRTTGVTLSKPTGAITMFSAAGSVVAATFTVTNTLVAATDTIILNQKSGTNLYVLLVTAVAAGSFNITFYTTGGVATDAPVINFAIIKGATA